MACFGCERDSKRGPKTAKVRDMHGKGVSQGMNGKGEGLLQLDVQLGARAHVTGLDSDSLQHPVPHSSLEGVQGTTQSSPGKMHPATRGPAHTDTLITPVIHSVNTSLPPRRMPADPYATI